jgi:4-hydroxybenzoate polyprenyltransferase
MNRLWRVLRGGILVSRLPTSFIAGAMLSAPQILSGAQTFSDGALNGCPLCLATMSAFTLNDLFDEKKDRVNKPHRAIPSGLMTRAECVFLVLTTATLSVFMSLCRFDLRGCLLQIVMQAALFGYTLIVWFCPLLKTLYTACLCVAPLLYSARTLPSYSSATPIIVASLLFLIGRELIMDLYDLNGDRLAQARTFPVVCGRSPTILIALTFQGTGIMLFRTLLPKNAPIQATLGGLFLLLISAVLLGACKNSRLLQRFAILGQWVLMVGGLFFFMQSGARIQL